ncbi:MAG: hypothetical protein ACLP75_28065 [Mycobacterium sp.]|uniref:hypothetical protein n=3 Tax=Mycobacterium sp. TaxID=1785 RepID=UPI003F96FEB7
MTVPQMAPARTDQIMDSVQLAVPVNGFHLEPRCRVCRNDQMRTKVNGLLASGASYAMIQRALDEYNARFDKRDQVTIDSIRNHSARHFPVQNVAAATYREILERRSKENGVDFVEGVATAITPMALYETIMVRGYQNLVDPDTKIDVNTAMTAAGRLQSLIDSRAGQPDMVDMLVQLNRIISAVKSTVPESMWPEIVRKLKGEDEASEPLENHDADVFDPADDPFDDELDDLDD